MEYSDLQESFSENTFDPEMVYQQLPSQASGAMNPQTPPPLGFERTGQQIPLNPDELVTEVIEQLRQFDRQTRQGQTPPHNPYQDPVLFTTSQGQQVQIPPQIQHTAIEQWNQQRQVLERARQQQASATPTLPQLPTPQTGPASSPPLSPPTPQVNPRSSPVPRVHSTHLRSAQPLPPLSPASPPRSRGLTSTHLLFILVGMAIMYFVLSKRNCQPICVY